MYGRACLGLLEMAINENLFIMAGLWRWPISLDHLSENLSIHRGRSIGQFFRQGLDVALVQAKYVVNNNEIVNN